LLYESAFVCSVCQRAGVHIHHIDRDNANNDPRNLVVLCQAHHDEAHTHRELSQNLTPALLRTFKADWAATVRTRRQAEVSVTAQRAAQHAFMRLGVQWGYINHARVAALLTPQIRTIVSRDLTARCVARGLVDTNGIIIPPDEIPPPRGYVSSTIYDWFKYGDDHALHALYSSYVDAIASQVDPVHLSDENWSRRAIANLVPEGSFIYINRGQYFRKVREARDNAHVAVVAFRRHIRIEYFLETRDMFGTTSITGSFAGHQRVAALLLVKTIAREGGNLVLRCTPIALGIGFQSPSYEAQP